MGVNTAGADRALWVSDPRVGKGSDGNYCTCTYFSGIHILAELAPHQVR